MKAQVVIAGIVGIVVGATITGTVQGKKVPPAYFIAEAQVKDIEVDKRIIAKLPATAAKFGGRYLARGGKTISFGGEPPKRIVIVAFDSLDKVQAWRAAPETKALEEERKAAGTVLRHYAVEGLAE
jgi:uncharacterized protein (DUF1330 family)